MNDNDIIQKYFGSEIDARQAGQFAAMREIYAEWNARINVVSRKDIDSLCLHHVLHSLAIARVCRFGAGARVIDIGCGGGFPCVPLAVLFPEVHFVGVDSVGKKIRVVQEVCRALGIDNLTAVNARIESLGNRADYVVSRAVADLPALVRWAWPHIDAGQAGTLPNGLLCLKGGQLDDEIAATGRRVERWRIAEMFDEEYFLTKEVLYIRKA